MSNKVNLNDLKRYFEWVATLKLGDEIILRWTNCGGFYSAKAIISKINKKSIIGKLKKELKASNGVYPEGNAIKVPRPSWSNVDWTWNNCPMPLEPIGS